MQILPLPNSLFCDYKPALAAGVIAGHSPKRAGNSLSACAINNTTNRTFGVVAVGYYEGDDMISAGRKSPTLTNPESDLISLADAAKLVTKKFKGRRNGKPLHVSTIHRWITRGIGGVRLKAVRIGGTRAVTPAALDEFFSALAGDEATPPPTPTKATAANQRRLAAANRQLDHAGI
jgi:hypothetical protein